MKLKKLLKAVPQAVVRGNKELDISGLCADSRLVAPGHLFIAKKGRHSDGAQYIDQAEAAGAIAVLTDLYNPFRSSLTQVIVDDVAAAEALLAQAYYGDASQSLFVAGITGTDGKTTTAYLLKHLLEAQGIATGLIGTVEYILGRVRRSATLTTPDLLTMHKMLREMVNEGCRAAVFEVSSHALEQGRVAAIDFDVGIFTNLSAEHLDYHGSYGDYGRAKQKLFTGSATNAAARCAVINGDDAFGRELIAAARGRPYVYGCGPEADLRIDDPEYGDGGMRFSLQEGSQRVTIALPLIGLHNVYNATAAVAALRCYGVALHCCVAALASFNGVVGRLQPVPNGAGVRLFVDFAHTPRALQTVLEALRRCYPSQTLRLVFGCGGDRDRQKRPLMAQVAQRYCDSVIVTSDNPRGEPPPAIIDEVVSGFTSLEKVTVLEDRHSAIYEAVRRCRPGDILLIAGKGHEKHQLVKGACLPFDDVEVASAACRECHTEAVL